MYTLRYSSRLFVDSCVFSARGLLANRLTTTSDNVKNIVIYGNHSKTQVPDAFNAVADINGKRTKVSDAIADDEWLSNEFMTTVQQRGAAVIAARGLSSAMSAANAIKDHFR